MNFDAIMNGTATIGCYIALGIFAFIVISAVSGLIFGLSRGFGKTLLRFITVAASAVAAFFIVIWLYEFVDAWFAGKTLTEVIVSIWPDYTTVAEEGLQQIISSFDAITAERLIMMVTAVAVAPSIFVGVFYLMKLLTFVVYAIFAGILGFVKKERSVISTLLGGVIGAAQGALIAAVALLPMSGFLGLAADMREPLTSADKPEETVAVVEDFYVNYLDDVINSQTVNILRTYGGDFVFEKMSMITVGESEVDMREETKSLAEIFVDGMPLGAEFDWMHPTAAQKEALRAILADVDGDPYHAAIVSGLLRGISTAVCTEAFPLELEEPFHSFAMQFVATFTTSNETNIGTDLVTFLEVYFTLSDANVLAAFDSSAGGTLDPTELLIATDEDGNTVINNIITLLNDNPRTRPIVTALTKFSLQLMMESFPAVEGVPEDVDIEAVYEDVKEGVNDLLATVNSDATPEEKKAEVSASLDTTLKENNIALDQEIVDSIADHVVENFEGIEELSDEDINKALLEFYNAYAESQGTTEAPVLPDDLPDDLGGLGDIGDLLG